MGHGQQKEPVACGSLASASRARIRPHSILDPAKFKAVPQGSRSPQLSASPVPRVHRFPLLLALCLLLGACASAPKVERLRPAAAPLDSASDEAGLIMQMDRYETELAHSPQVVRDPALNRYLQQLTCEVAGDYCAEIRIYLIRQPYFNAQMAPNGMLIIWTGLLLRIEDEAQLAAVIGHEVGHYVERHSLARWRKLKSTSNLAMALQVLGGGVIGAAASLGAYGGLFAFSRDQEREADDYGMVRLRQLGYDDRRVGALWADVWQEEKMRDRELLSSIFATHPASEERRDRLTAAAQDQSERREAASYWTAIEPNRAAWLEDEIGRRHYSQTQVLLQRLCSLPQASAETLYFEGEMYRRRGQNGDLERARTSYEQSITSAEAPAAAWRGLGLVLRQQAQPHAANDALHEYLRRAPNAEDRAMIESWLQ